MRWGELTSDNLDQIIIQGELEIARIRARQMAAIQTQRSAETHVRDGYRSIVDWAAARADVSHQTARKLCWTSSRLQHAPDLAEALLRGEITFDRAEQLSKLPEGKRQDHEYVDIAQLRRRAALHRRLTRKDEEEISRGQFLNIQPDDTVFNVWGEFDAIGGAITEKALDQRADELITDGNTSVAERRALAWIAICQDSLYDSHDSDASQSAEVSIIADARDAAPTDGEAGVTVLNGPRVGKQALDGVVCNSIVEVTGITADGVPLNMGRRSRTVPPQLRRHVLHRDLGCAVDGCSSRYRLEAHHVVPASQGGAIDADNLITLCWFHHRVVVHRWGHQN
jgi:hypothetical protein